MNDHLSEITHVADLCRNSCVIRYTNPDGTQGKARVKRQDWPEGYWSPGVGDLVRVDGAKDHDGGETAMTDERLAQVKRWAETTGVSQPVAAELIAEVGRLRAERDAATASAIWSAAVWSGLSAEEARGAVKIAMAAWLKTPDECRRLAHGDARAAGGGA